MHSSNHQEGRRSDARLGSDTGYLNAIERFARERRVCNFSTAYESNEGGEI